MLACLWIHDLSFSPNAKILDALDSFSPSIEVLNPTHILLDLGSQPKASVAQRILDALPQLPCSIGLAEARFVAIAAAHTAAPRTSRSVAPSDYASFLAPLPLSTLPLSPEILRRFSLLGIHTLSQLGQLPENELANQFGPEGSRIAALVRGQDVTPLSPLPTKNIFSHTFTFDTPIEGGDYLLHTLYESLTPLFDQLKEKHLLTSRLSLRLDALTIPIALRSPTRDPTRLLPILREHLSCIALPHAIDTFEISLEDLVPEHARQLSLPFLSQQQRGQGLERVFQRLRARSNPPHLMQLIWDDPNSCIPERHAHLQDRVIPTRSRGLYLPRPIKVVTDPTGSPSLVRTCSGWHAVEEVMEAWEVDEDWWTPQPIQRAYYRVLLRNGGVLRLFQEESGGGGWYAQTK